VPVPRRFDRRPPERDTTRINERIRVPEVRLIDENGNQVGVMRTDEALRYAQGKDLDLVEVAPEAKPPVCRVLDYSKYKYEQAQKQKATQAPAADRRPRDQVPPEDRRARLLDEEGPRRALPAPQGQGQDHDHVPRSRGDPPRARRDDPRPPREDLASSARSSSGPIQDGRNMTMLLGPSKAVLADALDDGHEADDVDLDSLEDRDDQLPSGEAVPESETPAPADDAPEGTDAPPGDESAVLGDDAKDGTVKPARTIQSDAEKENVVVTDDGNIVGAEDEPLGSLPPPPKKPAAKKAAPKKAPVES
jgi:translation initiation factor IF-3